MTKSEGLTKQTPFNCTISASFMTLIRTLRLKQCSDIDGSFELDPHGWTQLAAVVGGSERVLHYLPLYTIGL